MPCGAWRVRVFVSGQGGAGWHERGPEWWVGQERLGRRETGQGAYMRPCWQHTHLRVVHQAALGDDAHDAAGPAQVLGAAARLQEGSMDAQVAAQGSVDGGAGGGWTLRSQC